MLEQIATELKLARIRKGKTLDEVGEDMQMSRETIRKYETTEISVSIEMLEKLLKYYGVDADIFFKNVCAYLHN